MNNGWVKLAGLGLALSILSGCAGLKAKETSAPCKRPANVMAYGPDVSAQEHDCGPMLPVNRSGQDALRALAATEKPGGGF